MSAPVRTSGAAPLRMDLEPGDEELLVRSSVAAIVEHHGGAEYQRRCRREGRPPTELWDELGAAGFLGLNVPVAHGGGGLGMTGLAWVMEELSLHGVTLALLVVSPAIAGQILVRHGSDEQQARWLPGIADGTARFAFGLTEPDAGSNTHRITTSVTPTGDGGWRLRGQKTFISGVEHSDGVLVVARTRQPDGRLGQPVLVVVDRDAPGLTRRPVPTTVPWAEQQWTLFLDDIEIAPDRLVGGASGGLAAVFDGLNPERIMAAAGGVGAARRALDRAVAYARERVVFDAPIGSHQAIAHPLAEVHVQLESARLLLRRACALYDAGDPRAGEACNVAKLVASDVAVQAADRAIQTHGGNGMTEEFGLTDMWLGARLGLIAPVSREMVLNHVAQHALGLPRSY